ncbi:MAG: phosphoserine phosphatase SerB [Hyphomicrobiaceae bacterium]|nr:phosphoserine phosphatase SerB [Hyphomicrobiaceae bacterium]
MQTPQRQVLVLTAPADAPCLGRTVTDTITRLIAKDAVISQRWLSQGEAWEMVFAAQGDGGAHLERQAATALLGLPVDINIVPDDGAQRKKRLLVADMDSTIIEQECIDEIADFAGVRDEVSAITEKAMRGELDFEDALKARVALLRGLEESVLDTVLSERISLMPGALKLIGTMKAHGAYCALVSGGFGYFTSRIAATVGFDADRANTLDLSDGQLAGTVAAPILGRDAKLAALRSFARELQAPLSATLAVGDGANDLAMLKAAGLGVAYRAKPLVALEARCAVTHADLRALLYLQGYERAEFAG